jgi:hypothetical protein
MLTYAPESDNDEGEQYKFPIFDILRYPQVRAERRELCASDEDNVLDLTSPIELLGSACALHCFFGSLTTSETCAHWGD